MNFSASRALTGVNAFHKVFIVFLLLSVISCSVLNVFNQR